MSTSKTRPPTSRKTAPTRRSGLRRLAVIGVLVVLGGLVAAISIDVGASQEELKEQKTGQVGPMGGAVIDIPMEASGTAAAGGVEVVGAQVAMGEVPLDVTVVPTWTLSNSGVESVQIGQPHASVIEGCCPGPLDVETDLLAPGESTRLRFPLQMHPGMDGPHDFIIHVPIGDEVLELGVTGDFRN